MPDEQKTARGQSLPQSGRSWFVLAECQTSDENRVINSGCEKVTPVREPVINSIKRFSVVVVSSRTYVNRYIVTVAEPELTTSVEHGHLLPAKMSGTVSDVHGHSDKLPTHNQQRHTSSS